MTGPRTLLIGNRQGRGIHGRRIADSLGEGRRRLGFVTRLLVRCAHYEVGEQVIMARQGFHKRAQIGLYALAKSSPIFRSNNVIKRQDDFLSLRQQRVDEVIEIKQPIRRSR